MRPAVAEVTSGPAALLHHSPRRDPTRLLRALPTVSTPAGRQAAGVYRLAVHQLRGRPVEEAAAYLELSARQQRSDGLAHRIKRLGLAQPWSVRWAAWQPATAHHIGGRHVGPVFALAVGELDGRLIAVSGGEDETVRVWDLDTDTPVGEPLTGHTGSVNAVAVSELDGRPIAVSGGEDKTVRVWDLREGTAIGEPLTGHAGPVVAVAVGELDGRPVAVSGSTEDETVRARVWDLHAGALIGEPLAGHTGFIHEMVLGSMNSRLIAVTVSGKYDRVRVDETVRVWDLHTGTLIGEPLSYYGWGSVQAVAVGELDGRSIVVTGSADKTVPVWDLHAGTPIGEPLTGHTDSVNAVVLGKLDGHPIAITGGEDETVRVWDLHTRRSYAIETGAPITAIAHEPRLKILVATPNLDSRTAN
jgi:WD40 repeat protein